MTIAEAQARVDAYIGQFQVGYFEPLANLARLVEEQGELARELLHHHGPKPKKPGEAPGTVADEIGDVLFTIICLANSLKIDLDEALWATIRKYEARDRDRWPRHSS
jgi:NTP pyrophosphatase (non-canonical NTP hydrolase)